MFMAGEDELSESNTYSDVLQEMNQEQRGQLYLACVMNSWEDAYEEMEEFVTKFRREFGPALVGGESAELYKELMDKSANILGIHESEYSRDPNLDEAFLYLKREDPNVEEFREAVTSVIKEEKEWADYARESF